MGDNYHSLQFSFWVPHNSISLLSEEVCEVIVAEFEEEVSQLPYHKGCSVVRHEMELTIDCHTKMLGNDTTTTIASILSSCSPLRTHTIASSGKMLVQTTVHKNVTS
ncbi:hypothetical protein ScPMuIL_007071 [Solemya velum]